MAEKPSSQDFAPVRKDIAALLHQPEYDDGNAGPVLVRLAWFVPITILLLLALTQKYRHSAGTYDQETDTGGSNGAGMRYEAEGGDPSNAGLQHARVFLEPASCSVASSRTCPLTSPSDQGKISMDNVFRSVDFGRCGGCEGNGWTKHRMEGWQNRLCE